MKLCTACLSKKNKNNERTNGLTDCDSDFPFKINCAGLHIQNEMNCVNLQGVKKSQQLQKVPANLMWKTDTRDPTERCPRGTFAGQQIKWRLQGQAL